MNIYFLEILKGPQAERLIQQDLNDVNGHNHLVDAVVIASGPGNARRLCASLAQRHKEGNWAEFWLDPQSTTCIEVGVARREICAEKALSQNWHHNLWE